MPLTGFGGPPQGSGCPFSLGLVVPHGLGCPPQRSTAPPEILGPPGILGPPTPGSSPSPGSAPPTPHPGAVPPYPQALQQVVDDAGGVFAALGGAHDVGDLLGARAVVCPKHTAGGFEGAGRGLPISHPHPHAVRGGSSPCLNCIRTPASFWIFLIISPLRPMTTPTECRGTGTWRGGRHSVK